MNRHTEARMKQNRIYPPAHDRAGDGIPKKMPSIPTGSPPWAHTWTPLRMKWQNTSESMKIFGVYHYKI